MNDKIAYIIISVLFSDVHDAGYPISIDPTCTCNHQKNIKSIKRGQGKQNPGQKPLLERGSMSCPLHDQGQMVTAGKRAEQKHSEELGKEKWLLSAGAVCRAPGSYFSIQMRYAYLGH